MLCNIWPPGADYREFTIIYKKREGCLKNPLTGASQRERTKPSPDTHLDSQSCPNLYITHTQRQNQTPKSKKPFKNVARDTTPSINLQRKYASQRESYVSTQKKRQGGPGPENDGKPFPPQNGLPARVWATFPP